MDGLFCKHCDMEIMPGEVGVNHPWIHVTGWYMCASRFRDINVKILAKPEDLVEAVDILKARFEVLRRTTKLSTAQEVEMRRIDYALDLLEETDEGQRTDRGTTTFRP